MVEWSKTWDLSCIDFPITQVARVRTPLLSIFFLFFGVVTLDVDAENFTLPSYRIKNLEVTRYTLAASQLFVGLLVIRWAPHPTYLTVSVIIILFPIKRCSRKYVLPT